MNPSLDIEKYISVDNGISWIDADAAPGPFISSSVLPQFKFVVINNGDVQLTNVVVNDDTYGLIGTLPTLDPGQSFEWIILVPWLVDQHTNVATATGEYDGANVVDTDSANYFGVNPSILIIEYVSVDNGVTWIDANTPPGSYLPNGVNPQFRYVVTNNGNVQLTNVNVTDDLHGLVGTIPTLDPSASFEWIIL